MMKERTGMSETAKIIWGLFVLPIAICVFIWFAITMLVDQIERQPKTNQQPAATQVSKVLPTPAELYNEVNSIRVANGVPALSLSPELNRSAQEKCDDMVHDNYYGHDNPKNGRTGYSHIFERLPDASYGSENLIIGLFPNTSKEIFEGWFKSAPHKAAILDPRYEFTGFGVCQIPSEPDFAVVQHFAEVKEQPAPQPQVNNYYQQPAQPRQIYDYSLPRKEITNCKSYNIGSTLYTDCSQW